MIKYLAVLFIFVSTSVFAVEFIFCGQKDTCKCPNEKELPFKTRLLLKDNDGDIFECQNLQTFLPEEIVGQNFLSCREEEKRNLFDTTIIFPDGCDYVLKKFNTKGFRKTIETYLKDLEILCGGTNHSMCTSAVYLAFLAEARRLQKKGKISMKQLEEWSELKGPVWKYINDQARPDLMMENLNIGIGKVLRRSQVPDAEWPKRGDIVQFWRKDKSGHSTIFDNYLKDKTGTVIGICFWSSNLNTNGYGRTCEELSKIDRLIIGRMTI